jgi:Holliday junction resolvase-like predicted endonuclease
MDSNNAQSLIDSFKKEKYQFDNHTGLCNLPEDAKSDYDNALKILSEQLYSKDIHFIFELLQNAEDNHYADTVIPELSFELLANDPTNTPGCKGCLVIRNNEIGFNINNIKAISSIGKSTKANQKDVGYIGEKGIGFKSVFVVSSSPHIFSNGFKIKFLKDDPVTGLGYIVPYWVEDDFSMSSNPNETVLLLPLEEREGSETSIYDKVQTELTKLSVELVLFLKKLKKITIKTPNYYASYEAKREGNYVELSVESTNGNNTSKYLICSQMVSVPENAINKLRSNVTQREVSLAFPIGFELQQSPLYCYLPTESDTGLPFLVNADFILNASRESIRQDLTWNSWMRDEVSAFAAKSLANILSEKGEIDRWAWVPVFNSNRVIYWNCLREKVTEALKQAKCIPTLSGSYQLPSKCLMLSNNFKFLKGWPLAILNRQSADLFWNESSNISNISSSIGLNNFSQRDLVLLLEQLNNDDVLTNEQLIAAIAEITERKGKWGGSKKYDDFLKELRACNLFKCDSGLHNSKYKNLYLPSVDKHEVPVLVSHKGESTQPNYIDKKFYSLMPEHVKSAIRSMFNIDEVHAVSYLENSVVKFLKLNAKQCSVASLEELNCYLIEHTDDLPEETIQELIQVVPFKSQAGDWITKANLTRLVAPLSIYEKPLWQHIYFAKDELQHIVILHEDYLKWADLEAVEIFLDAFQINDYIPPFDISVNGSHRFKATPQSFLDAKFWQKEDNRKAAFEWLYKVYTDDDEIKSQFNHKASLSYFLLNEHWLLSTSKSFVNPSSTLHCFSETERGLFGSSLNYIADSVSKVFAKKLGLVTEPTPRGFMDQIKAEKEKESIDAKFLALAYESLANWKDPNEVERIKKRLTQDRLIYLPKPRHQWVSVEQVIWDDKAELGSSFVGLSSYLPDHLKYYFVDTLNVTEFHGIESYFSAYSVLAEQNKFLNKSEVACLNELVRRITQYVKSDDFSLDAQWNNFVSNIKVYTDLGNWLGVNSSLYVADDGKIKELFQDHSTVYFTWSNATEFFNFFEQIGVKKASENISVSVSNINGLRNQDTNQVCTSAKKAICLYVADNQALTEDSLGKLASFYHAHEYSCEQLTVKYSIENQAYIEVNDELGVYDTSKPGLILTNHNDPEDVKDELSVSIARYYFGKFSNRYEKSIRHYLNIRSEARLNTVIKNDGLELDSEKEALFNNILKPVNSNAVILERDLDESATLVNAELDKEENDNLESEPLNNDQSVDTNDEVINALTESLKSPDTIDRNEAVSEANVESVDEFVIGDDTSNQNRDNDIHSENNQESEHSGSNESTSQGVNQYNQECTEYVEDHSGNHHQQNQNNRPTLSLKKGVDNPPKVQITTNREYFEPDKENTKEPSSLNPNRQSPGYRLFSYVENDVAHERTEKSERDDQAFGNKAEIYVKQWLEGKGYKVVLFGGTNKGYDLTAIDPNTGEIKFVEVKGQRGAWNRTGVAMSYSQMNKCLIEGDNYWFIVVESLLSSPKIHKFINPASLIDRYYFDSNWALLPSVETKDISVKEIDIDDLLFDEESKEIYKKIIENKIITPEIGFELSNDVFEVIAELEFAWPNQKVGIYIDEPEITPEDWQLYSIEKVLLTPSLLTEHDLHIKEDTCSLV